MDILAKKHEKFREAHAKALRNGDSPGKAKRKAMNAARMVEQRVADEILDRYNAANPKLEPPVARAADFTTRAPANRARSKRVAMSTAAFLMALGLGSIPPNPEPEST